MTYPILTKRVLKSPVIETRTFEDGTFVNLIQIDKPYANGNSFAVYETTKCAFCSNGVFKTYKEAKRKFDLMVKNAITENRMFNLTNGDKILKHRE